MSALGQALAGYALNPTLWDTICANRGTVEEHFCWRVDEAQGEDRTAAVEVTLGWGDVKVERLLPVDS